MFEGIRRWIGQRITRFRFRKTREKVISFSRAISDAKQALVIMPLHRREFLPTVTVIDMLRRQFQERNLTIITSDYGLEVVRMLPHSQFIHMLSSEVNLFFLPKRNVMERILKKKYDVAIDLNLDLVLPSGYICKESGARVRIGFTGAGADTFYNFQIQPDPTLGKKLIYDRLAKCLEMF
jgi:ADP-heptose:LPS heptosyltransferase